MAANNDQYGTLFMYNNNANVPSIILNPDTALPSLSFAPNGSLPDGSNSLFMTASRNSTELIFDITKGSVPLLSLRDSPSDGSVLSIPAYSNNALNLSSPTRVMLSDASGNIGTRASVPVTIGGTGLTSLPSSGRLLASNGTGYIGISAGTGININTTTGTISAIPITAPTFTQIAYNVDTVSTAITLNPTGDASEFIVDYNASSTGTQVVANINITGYDVLFLRIESAMKRTSAIGGAASQEFNVVKNATIGGYPLKPFGNNTTSIAGILPSNVRVNPVLSGNIIALNITLVQGDNWKGLIKIISI